MTTAPDRCRAVLGILHDSDGSGTIGAGVAEAPLGCFPAALPDLSERLRSEGDRP